ncbi:MAG: hypothetical protein NWE78_07545 [Candidatus Bathyarchaeota archaeon]|nr:hypothetical protein [Candidatus Bathyarchaeota archaeon]
MQKRSSSALLRATAILTHIEALTAPAAFTIAIKSVLRMAKE